MSFINISRKKCQIEETEEPILLEIVKPKIVEKKDELDISGEVKENVEEPEKKEEELPEGEKPKFKPEGFSWTSYDGVPRNHIQVVSKFTKYPISEENTTMKNIDETLMDILYNDIKSKEGKIHLVNY